MNRRDFLRPRHLAHSAGQVLGALDELRSLPEAEVSSEEVRFLRLSRRAMATDFEIIVPFGTPRAREAAEDGLDLIDRLEEQLTVYRDSSEVSQINRRAASEPVVVEEKLFKLFAECAELTRRTDGAFDITAGALIKAWGFFRRAGRVPSAEERRQVLDCTGMRHVLLDAEKRTIRFARAGLEINLGSVGKGYALDRWAELLRPPHPALSPRGRGQGEGGISSALLHGGHSSVYAIGNEPLTSPSPLGGAPETTGRVRGRGWRVGVRHPWDRERRLGIVWLRDRALATSAATFQHLEYNGRKLGHVLDPRTGWPAETMASVTVLAASAAEADALATAFFILGLEPARRYCAAHPEIGAVLLPAHEDALPVILGMEEDEIELHDKTRGAAHAR